MHTVSSIREEKLRASVTHGGRQAPGFTVEQRHDRRRGRQVNARGQTVANVYYPFLSNIIGKSVNELPSEATTVETSSLCWE